ncbi:hypothetical protein [Altererythrobacter sp. Root672]|uniref:hypothetical protein n=1 Tax=Altererythrobacter sp. Root672 TaxID=1736584 RepID=UPI001F3A6363|nr:hypothetical protein [Altererythrobacter sp. Root672]
MAAMFMYAAPASAQVVLEANGANSEDLWGGELGVGYSIVSAGGFRVTPSVGAFLYQGDDDRYYLDDNGGNPRCRDSTNGQYADTKLCDDTAAEFYARAEATYSIPAGFTFGGGVRYMADEFRPYGTLAIPLAPKLLIKGNAGPEYFAAGLQARF